MLGHSSRHKARFTFCSHNRAACYLPLLVVRRCEYFGCWYFMFGVSCLVVVFGVGVGVGVGDVGVGVGAD